MVECCENCRYFVAGGGSRFQQSKECRRHAPVLEPRIDASVPDRGWWSQVETDEWCGEWQARNGKRPARDVRSRP
jgi:hypothetical protein